MRRLALAGLALPALLLVSAPVQAQMYHLYLICEGTVSAGPGASSEKEVPKATKRGGPEARSASADAAPEASDKNRLDTDENSQARLRAVRSALKRGDAHLELALRDNNMSMLIQRSNVLPTGHRLGYAATNSHYTATYLPHAGAAEFKRFGADWLFTWYPPFQKLRATRFSVDRQTGVLEGDMVGPDGEVIGLLDMQCQPRRHDEAPPPRF